MKSISKELFDVRAERDDLGVSIINSQNALTSAKQQSSELKNEFVKTGVFYKGELTKAFEKRKVLEMKVDNAVLEHESLTNLLDSSRSEQTSVNKMLDTAHVRLDNLDVLEQNVIELEAENAQIKHDAARAKQEAEALQRDNAEMEALKTQNKELSHCLKSMENSRKQYEIDAKRYRDHAGQSEQQSETLRVRLDDMQKNFAEIETQQLKDLEKARKTSTTKKSNGQAPPPQEVDDLKQIIGVGKVFEKTLHDLGITSYRQIAAFTVTDIARINRELKEFKGRMEQDDWVGQAKELCFKKYGEIQ
jgi:predicted flap endonuclease-1-like 5' DNA nuclease